MRSIRTWRLATLGLWVAFGAVSCGYVGNVDAPCFPTYDPWPETEICQHIQAFESRDLISDEGDESLLFGYGTAWAFIMIVVNAFRLRTRVRTWELFLHGFLLTFELNLLHTMGRGSIGVTLRYGEGFWLPLWLVLYGALWVSLIRGSLLHRSNTVRPIQAKREQAEPRSVGQVNSADHSMRLASIVLWAAYGFASVLLLFTGGTVQTAFESGLPHIADLMLGDQSGMFWMGAVWASVALVWNILRYRTDLSLADITITAALLAPQNFEFLMVYENDPGMGLWRFGTMSLWIWWWVALVRMRAKLSKLEEASPATS